MNKYVWFIIAIVLLSILLIYKQFGGTDRLDFTLGKQQELMLYGREFSGRSGEEILENNFNEVQAVAIKRHIPIYIITYKTSEEKVHQFIGLTESESQWDSTKMNAGEYIEAYLDMPSILIPTPQKVMAKAAKFAEENSRKLEDKSLEIYRKDKPIQVLIPVKKD